MPKASSNPTQRPKPRQPQAPAAPTPRDAVERWLAVAVIACMGATLGGVFLSFYLDSSPAATIVLILTATFVVAFLRRSRQIRRATATA